MYRDVKGSSYLKLERNNVHVFSIRKQHFKKELSKIVHFFPLCFPFWCDPNEMNKFKPL